MPRKSIAAASGLALAIGSTSVLIASSSMLAKAQSITTNPGSPFKTAVGHQALINNQNQGLSNTAIGFQALISNTVGNNNTASGFGALFFNTTGSSNTAIGDRTLNENRIGSFNTALGSNALFFNNAGANNTASGYGALYRNTASNNTANGFKALMSNSSGADNTALGNLALNTNTQGSQNTAIGSNALSSLNAGSNNIAIGSGAGMFIVGSNNIDIAAEGSAADGKFSTKGVIRIGDRRLHEAFFVAGVVRTVVPNGVPVFIDSDGKLGIQSSSGRFKNDIHPIGDSLSEKLLQLNPVSFRYHQPGDHGDRPLHYGLLAEDVARVLPEMVQFDETGRPNAVYYHYLAPLLLRSFQREHQQLEEQQVQFRHQSERLNRLASNEARHNEELAQLKQQLAAQRHQILERQADQLVALQAKVEQLERRLSARHDRQRISLF